MEHVTTADMGEMYEVDEMMIDFDRESGQFCWVFGSGCSCWEGYGDLSTLGHYDGHGTAQDAHDALDQWATEGRYSHSISDAELAECHQHIASWVA